MAISKCPVDAEFPGTWDGILRLCTLALGGGVFGTLSYNSMFDRPSSHALMWVSIFAWVITLLFYIGRLVGKPLATLSAEWKINKIFCTLYLITAIVFGVYDIVDKDMNLQYGGKGVLVFLFAALNFLDYLFLFILQWCNCKKDSKAFWQKLKSPNKKKPEADPEEGKPKDDNENDEQKVSENGKADEPEPDQTEQTEEKEVE